MLPFSRKWVKSGLKIVKKVNFSSKLEKKFFLAKKDELSENLSFR